MTQPAVLIADDEEAICFALSREARRHGLTPLIAADGARAVALADSAGEGLVAVVLDIRMPRLDGVSAALAILAARPGTYLALMTAFGDYQLPAALGNAVRLFRKPFDLAAFSDWLACAVPREASVSASSGAGPLEFGADPRQAGAA